ncbi:hypothetical protein [Cellulomonas sp. URHB0016]
MDLLARIRESAALAEQLAVHFDFDVTRLDPVEDVRLGNGDRLIPIAGDASGGTYLTTPSGAVVYAGSEGEGGLVAHSLRDALALVVGLPSLHDALSRPLDEDLPQWLRSCDDEIREDFPELDATRAEVREALGLPPVDTLVAALHASATDDSFRPISEHGPYDSMVADAPRV